VTPTAATARSAAKRFLENNMVVKERRVAEEQMEE
jgi:hypothetical protein